MSQKKERERSDQSGCSSSSDQGWAGLELCMYVDEHIDTTRRLRPHWSVGKNCRNSPAHCVSVCVCVIDTSDSIEYDSPRLSFNTHATTEATTYACLSLTHAHTQSLSVALASYFNRGVYAGILPVTKPSGVCRRRRRRWHLPLYFDFILNARHARRHRLGEWLDGLEGAASRDVASFNQIVN